jgi:hypothetical protein
VRLTAFEYQTERRHIYETRLGMFGLGPNDNPTADQHNMAVAEADGHIAALKQQERLDSIADLRKLKESL